MQRIQCCCTTATVLDGHTLRRPANYLLVQILPGPGMTVDPTKRPYMIIAPPLWPGQIQS